MNPGLASPRHPRRALVALLTAAAGAVGAQTSPAPAPLPARPTPPMASAAPPAVFPIRGFVLEGENPIGDAQAQRVLAPYIRPDANLETLQQATAELEKALRDQGFGLHRVALPPQELGATVRLSILKFSIGKVVIEGAQIYDDKNVRLTVPELREGESPNFKMLAVQTAIANENANKLIQVGLRESEEPDQIDATITVREQKPWNIGLSASNAGTEASGEDRVTITGSHSNLFNRDHQFIGAYTTSLERTDDVRQLGLLYKVPLYAQGGVVGVTYTRSDVVGNFGTFTSTGAGHTLGASYTMYLPPEGGRRSYVTLAFDDKVFEGAQISGVAGVQQDRRSRPITVGYTARTETDTAVWGYSAEVAANTGTGANNDLASYRSEDPRIDTVHWKALRGSASYSSPFAQTWLWSVRALAQYSPDVLISGEQFGLGGVTSVRGTNVERPISGDQGISATFEVTSPEVVQGLRFLVFVDAGWIGNNSPTTLSKPSSDHLASVGLGARYVMGNFAASLEYGRLVSGSRVSLAVNSSSPQRGDDRFYVSVSIRF